MKYFAKITNGTVCDIVATDNANIAAEYGCDTEVPANTPVGARVPLEEGGEWRPPLPTDESIDADTQLAIIAPLGYTLNQLQPAMIRQMNMIAEGSKLEGLDIRGLATEAQQARLSYLKDFLDFVDDCRAHGAERKSNPEMPAAYPTPPTEVN